MEGSEWSGKDLSEDKSETSEKWLVFGGNFGELFGFSSKEGMEVSDSDISDCK